LDQVQKKSGELFSIRMLDDLKPTWCPSGFETHITLQLSNAVFWFSQIAGLVPLYYVLFRSSFFYLVNFPLSLKFRVKKRKMSIQARYKYYLKGLKTNKTKKKTEWFYESVCTVLFISSISIHCLFGYCIYSHVAFFSSLSDLWPIQSRCWRQKSMASDNAGCNEDLHELQLGVLFSFLVGTGIQYC
jgi:hypothetical protein